MSEGALKAGDDDATLAGVVVIEHGKGVAASYAGRVLALMGATVIKIECPTGDALRREQPLLRDAADSGVLFNYLNINKSSVTLDITGEEGARLLGQMLARADILIDDTLPAERPAFHLDPATICARHPRLIYASVLPFGATGPHAAYRAYELNVFHSGGEGYLMPNGLALEMFPDRPPVKIYGHFAELVGGLSAASGIMAALLVQDESGGQFVDISEQDANVAISCFNVQRVGDGVVEYRAGRSFRYGGVLECADGYVQVLTLEPRQWAGLVKLMGEPAWTQDPALQEEIERGRRGPEINRHLREWARPRKVAELVTGGQALGVPIAKYAEPAEVINSAQSKARHIFTPLDIEGLGEVPVLTAPYQLTLPPQVRAYPAKAGADNQKILCEWLGHAGSELERWTRAQVV